MFFGKTVVKTEVKTGVNMVVKLEVETEVKIRVKMEVNPQAVTNPTLFHCLNPPAPPPKLTKQGQSNQCRTPGVKFLE